MVGARGHGDRVRVDGDDLLADDRLRDAAEMVREERGVRALHQAVRRGVVCVCVCVCVCAYYGYSFGCCVLKGHGDCLRGLFSDTKYQKTSNPEPSRLFARP